MRCVTGLWLLISASGHAQSNWAWEYEQPGVQLVATDASQGLEGWCVASISYSGQNGALPSTSRLHWLDASGLFISSNPLLGTAANVQAFFLLQREVDQRVYVGGSAELNGLSGVFMHAAEFADDSVWSYHSAYGGVEYTSALNGLVRDDGTLLIGGNGVAPPGYFNRAILVVLEADGTPVADAVYGTTPDQAIVRHVALWNQNVWMTIDGGGLDEFEGAGGVRAFRLNEVLDVEQWFTIPTIDQDPDPPLDSIPRDGLDLIPISPDRFASSGRFGSLSPPMQQAVIFVSDTAGTLIRRILPRSAYPMDFPPFLQALSKGDEERLWFAMHENAQLGPPSLFSVFEPNRIHVFKLDTNLNVMCEHILDGFAENAYYYLNRIKATDDGGFLLLGGRRDFNDPGGYFAAWAQKFGPDDCIVGLTEKPGAEAVIFPNPGSEGFTLMLGGEAINGTMLVLDALGRDAGNSPIRQGGARFDANGLAAGVYLYRALDAKGVPRSVGRWVKE